MECAADDCGKNGRCHYWDLFLSVGDEPDQ